MFRMKKTPPSLITVMQKQTFSRFGTCARIVLSLLFLSLLTRETSAQCPTVEAVMVDACGTEFLNEFLIINSGGGFNTSDIMLDYDVSNNIVSGVNNDVNTDNGNLPGGPCGIAAGSAGAYTGCSNLISVGPGVDIPANSIVVFQTSSGAANSTYNFSSLCGSGQCVYVVASACTRSAGGFTNGAGSGTRTSVFSIAGGCSQTITYALASLTGGNGAYFLPLANGGAGGYGNGGCAVPPSSAAPSPPVINPLPNVSTCGTYTLPPITGTNLPANVAYFTGTNGTGTQYNPGDEISMTTTLYIYAQNGPVGCTDQEQFTVTITPGPSVNQPNDVTVCAGSPVSVPLTGSGGTTFPWTNDNTATGLAASGTGNISFTSANVTTQQVSTVTVTPTQGMCMGTPVTFTITIDPKPTVDDPPNITVCAGDPVDVPLTSPNGSPTFNWTNNNVNIGLAGTGSGDISFTAANVVNNQTGTIVITPVENGCTGPTQNFTITVGPLPSVNQPADVTVCGGAPVSVVFSGSPGGTTFSWTNDNTNIGLGAMGTGNISFTSANPADDETATITVVPMLGLCAGAALTFTITIRAKPTLDDPPNITVCAGEPVDVMFTGSNPGANYNWTNTNTGIGLASFGIGDLNFNAANVANTQTGTINVTPSLNGCSGPVQNFTITVTPGPNVVQPSNLLYCGNAPVSVTFSGTSGATFNWTNDNPNIGLGDSGTGNISFTSSVVTTTQVANITVTPSLNGCDGTPRTFIITILASPTMNDPADLTVCGEQPVNVVFSGAGNGAVYSWQNNNAAIGLPIAGSGDLNFTTANNSATGTITVTPNLNGCPGIPQTFNITVELTPMLSTLPNLNLCGGQSVTVSLNSNVNWVNNNPAIGLPASGSDDISFTAANPATQQVATITATPVSGNCTGASVTFTITVKPAPTVLDPVDVEVCPGFNVNINFTGSPANAGFFWTNNNTNTGLDPSGAGNISFNAANVTTTQTSIVTVTPSANGCNGPVQTFSITVDALPTVNDPADQSVCAGAPVAVNFTGSAGATYSWTNNNPSIGLPASGTGNINFTGAGVATTQTGVITVTPMIGNCTGTVQTFSVTVSPAPAMSQPPDQAVCAGQPVIIGFTGQAGTTFAWTNNNTNIGLGASGNGNISFTSANVAAPETAAITVTPTANGCPGTPVTFNVNVNPSPLLTPVADLSACGGQPVAVNFSGTAGATLNWTNTNPAIGLGASGAGNISFNAAAVASTQTGSIIVTPSIGSCIGAADTFDISVVTAPVVNDPSDATACGGTPVAVNFTGSAGATFTWTNNNTAIGLPVSGTGNIGFTSANVGTPQTATISVTPTLGTCSGTSMDVVVTVNPAVTAAISGDQNLCAGESTTLSASGGPTINWSTSQSGSSITVTPATTTTYSAIVSNGAGCADTAALTVVVGQPSAITIQQSSCNPSDTGTVVLTLMNLAGCDSVVTTVTTLLPTDTVQLSNVSCDPNAAGTFTQVLSNIFGCDSVIINTVIFDPANIDTTQLVQTTCDPNQVGTTQLLFNGADGCDSLVITTTNLSLPDTTLLSAVTCDPNAAGVFTQTLTNIAGCDSLIITTVSLSPADTTYLSGTSCDPNATGTFTQNLSNILGCDSVIITTVTLLPRDTTYLSGASCDPNQAGTFTQVLSNIFGCDSVIINTIIFDPTNIDTTQLVQTTCDPSQTGTSQVLLTGSDGCDSLVITTVNLLPTSTTNLSATTCDPNAAGTFTQVLTNQFGCDSTVVTTVTLLPSSTTNLSATTCNPNATGTFTQMLTNQFGCDSTVITTVTFDPAGIDTTLAVASTCDPGLAGVFTLTYTNQFGCDSVLITTVLLLPSDTTTLFATTCDPAQAGTFPTVLSNQFGCDSLVVLVVDLLQSNITNVTSYTCNPNQTGTFTQVLPNQFGCDSTIITTVLYDPTAIDSTFQNATTCDPAQAGFSTMTLTGSDGCDSVVITYTLFDPVLCAVSALVNTSSAACPGIDDGTAVIVVTGGQAPFTYNWTDGAGNSGSGQISAVNTPELVNGLATGTFSVTVTGSAGPVQTVVSAEVPAVQGMSLATDAVLAYNGFAISCNGSADGSAEVHTEGGTPPYQYLWSNSDQGPVAHNLSAGSYEVTVTDDKGCTATSLVQLTEPLPLQLFTETAPVFCGDSLAEVTLLATGGAGDLKISVDGQPFDGLQISLPTGEHKIVVADVNNCNTDTVITLYVPTVPLLFLPADTTIRLGEILTITAQTNLDVWASLTWSPVPDSSCLACLQQTWMPDASLLYTLTIVDSLGCIATADIRVNVRQDIDIYIPNVFSPDDDGYNDLWQIDAGPSVATLENLRVFDRWGDQVYLWDESVPADGWPGWDGKTGGKAVELGVYVYYVEFRLVNGEKHIRKGDLTVMKRK